MQMKNRFSSIKKCFFCLLENEDKLWFIDEKTKTKSKQRF